MRTGTPDLVPVLRPSTRAHKHYTSLLCWPCLNLNHAESSSGTDLELLSDATPEDTAFTKYEDTLRSISVAKTIDVFKYSRVLTQAKARSVNSKCKVILGWELASYCQI